MSTEPMSPVMETADGGRRLQVAIADENLNEVEFVLRMCPSAIRWQDDRGNTALHTAILHRSSVALIGALLERRPDLATANREGNSCIHLAMSLRPAEPVLVARLMELGRWQGGGIGLRALCLPNNQGKDAIALGQEADGSAAPGYTNILQMLRDELDTWRAGVKVGLHAAANAGDIDAIEHLIRTTGFPLHSALEDGKTVMHVALFKRNARLVAQLLDLATRTGDGQIVNAPDQDQKTTPVMVAAIANMAPAIDLLVVAGADVNLKNKKGMSALHLAAHFGHLEVVKALLRCRADPDAREKRGLTPMMCAASNGYVDIMKLLRDAGGNINGKDNEGRTPLMHAYIRNQGLMTAAKMVVAGARDHMADNTGKTVREYQQESLARQVASGKSVCSIL
jgi:ankyrin repeat protein